MNILSPVIQEEYLRWVHILGPEDPYHGDLTLGIHDVLRAHFLIVDTFYIEGKGLGGIGPKSMDLLHSALHRQFTGYDGQVKWKTEFEVCATLMFGLIKDHPFHDANKRTAFLSSLYFLHRQGRCPSGSQREFEDFAVDIAEGTLSRHKRFKELQGKGVDDLEVRFIADFLKRNTREIDKRAYSVTYHQMNAILGRFGFALHNPHGNFIDVVQLKERRPILGLFGKKRTVYYKLADIGFPNWKAQMGKGAIKTIRTATQLDERHGVDSQAFFYGVDTIPSLINEYYGPLMRLANR